MKKIFAGIYPLAILLIVSFTPAAAQQQRLGAGITAPDPYILTQTAFPNNSAWGRTSIAPPSGAGAKAVVITGGQSLQVQQALGTYTTVNSNAVNFNIADGGVYPCVNPVLGTQFVPTFTDSPNCHVADGLVSNGTYPGGVIVVPMAVGGTLCSEWVPGAKWNHRIYVTLARLTAAKLMPANGYDLWIDWGQGESDNQAGTGQAALTACWQTVAQEFVNAGSGTARFMLHTESIILGAASSTVTSSQAAVFGIGTIRAGANWDSLGGTTTNRQVDLTHLNSTGNPAAAALVVTNITNCKNSSC